jgi:hypothetical protein
VLFQFISVYRLLRGQFSACQHELAMGNRVTFSAHLWQARSAFEFAVAWNERKHYLLKDLDTSELLETARPDDIDVFGKVMLTGIMGIDDVRGWLHTRGGSL